MRALNQPSITSATPPVETTPLVKLMKPPTQIQLPSLVQADPPLREQPKLVEEHVPVKKYYGRKRDDQSSSDDELNYNEDNEKDEPMDTTKYEMKCKKKTEFLC